LLARSLGLPKSAVRVARGTTQRLKQVDLQAIDQASLYRAFGKPEDD